ncbi:MAG: RnfABCDGE type electron transport complex subunit G [Bacteroidales bacterium]|nr:RnfABCDGE type electron transport complex subunit G [Bacteroidales bacterium]
MAAKSNLKNMALSLTLVCLVCSAVLGSVYAVTSGPIREAEQAKTTASIARVLPAFEGQPTLESVCVDGVDYNYYRAPGAGYAVISTVVGFGGPLTLMVGIGEDGVVYNTVVLSHSETPGLGAKCTTEQGFIDQFKGWDPAARQLAVRKDGGEVDAITASTITSRAYAKAVAQSCAVYKHLSENE